MKKIYPSASLFLYDIYKRIWPFKKPIKAFITIRTL